MAITIANLGASSGTSEVNPDIRSFTNATTYENTAWNPPTDGIIVIFIFSAEALGEFFVNSVTGHDLTWEPITGWNNNAIDRSIEMWAAYAAGATFDSTIIDFGGVTQLGCMASFMHITGAREGNLAEDTFFDEGVHNDEEFGAATTSTPEWAGTLPKQSGHKAIFACYHGANEATTVSDSDWIEADDMNMAGPATGFVTGWTDTDIGDAPVFSWTTSSDFASIVVEVRTPAVIAATPKINLIRSTQRW